MLYQVHLTTSGIGTLLVISTDCTDSCKSHYNTITTAKSEMKSALWELKFSNKVHYKADFLQCSEQLFLLLQKVIYFKINSITVYYHAIKTLVLLINGPHKVILMSNSWRANKKKCQQYKHGPVRGHPSKL